MNSDDFNRSTKIKDNFISVPFYFQIEVIDDNPSHFKKQLFIVLRLS